MCEIPSREENIWGKKMAESVIVILSRALPLLCAAAAALTLHSCIAANAHSSSSIIYLKINFILHWWRSMGTWSCRNASHVGNLWCEDSVSPPRCSPLRWTHYRWLNSHCCSINSPVSYSRDCRRGTTRICRWHYREECWCGEGKFSTSMKER